MTARKTWLCLHLGLGLSWIAVLALGAKQESDISLRPLQVGQMPLLAGWLPSVALAAWQSNHQRWKDLLLSDLLGAGVLVAIACTAYLPLFFFQNAWFLPFALLPRGCLTELALRLFKRAGQSEVSKRE
jgi:hypothetical protein